MHMNLALKRKHANNNFKIDSNKCNWLLMTMYAIMQSLKNNDSVGK